MNTTTKAKHSFYATLTAEVEITDEEFDLICECCKNHYDYKVKSLIEHGGFLYGANNKRNFSKEYAREAMEDFKDNDIEFSTSQLNITMKSLEQYYHSPKNEAKFILSKRLHNIFDELQEKQQEINKSLNHDI